MNKQISIRPLVSIGSLFVKKSAPSSPKGFATASNATGSLLFNHSASRPPSSLRNKSGRKSSSQTQKSGLIYERPHSFISEESSNESFGIKSGRLGGSVKVHSSTLLNQRNIGQSAPYRVNKSFDAVCQLL